VDTEGSVLKAKVRSAKVPDRDGVRLLLEGARTEIPSLKHLWLDAGYQGGGKRWIEEVLGLSVEIVRRPPEPIAEEVARRWAEEWAKEGVKPDWEKLPPRRGFSGPRAPLGRGAHVRMVEPEQEDELGDYERLCATAEAFIYLAR
jgi:transposase